MNPQPAGYYCINQWRSYVLSDREFQFRNPRSVPKTRSKLDYTIVDRAAICDLLTISGASPVIDLLFHPRMKHISNFQKTTVLPFLNLFLILRNITRYFIFILLI